MHTELVIKIFKNSNISRTVLILTGHSIPPILNIEIFWRSSKVGNVNTSSKSFLKFFDTYCQQCEHEFL